MTNIAGSLALGISVLFVVIAIFKDRIEDAFKGPRDKVEEHVEIKPHVRIRA
jgi:hypothetical protein